MSDTSHTPAGGSSWRITAQNQASEPNGMGQFVKGVNVAFVTDLGSGGSVFVPEAQYTVDNVKALVAAKAAEMDAVARLTG